jgi:branched-chain amino acid transport system permease protein
VSATPVTNHSTDSAPEGQQRRWYSQVNWVTVVASIFVLLLILRMIQVQVELAQAGKSYPPAYWALQFGNGLVLGGVYALIALGYTLVYGILLMINFAHGDVMMFGAYAGFFVLAACDAAGISKSNQVLTLVLVFAAGMLVSMLMGVGLERIAYRPLRAAPRLVPLITAIGASVFLEETARLIFGAPIRVYNKPPMLQGVIMLPGNIPVPITGVFIIVSSIVMMVAL